ncbi:hypothetical protein AB6A40_006293 [Gnathostoma spinigerum]|uniref:SHSP domain-containing protein n=1 Tax=Gnathostoma spinigerum TaxID=75299 RepID=A0ABD6EN72_9BILA
MALTPRDIDRYFDEPRWMTPFDYPMEQCFRRWFDRTMPDMNWPTRHIAPYWMQQPMLQECNIGNTLGKVVDDKEKFAVEVDVSQFRPEELQVNVKDNELVVEGHHEERTDEYGKIERHFVRKYMMPKEARVDAVVSQLNDKGVLSVTAPKTPETENMRKIPIQPAPKPQKQ